MTAILLSLTAAAQRYPVTVTPTLLTPYTLNLSELTAPASARLMATITVNDLTASNLPVRLHFKLESNDITIESIKTAAVAPLFLGGGETLVLTGSDLAQYLRLDNLDFRGYSKEQYRQTGQLPGGMWRLTVEVHHFYNHRVLSNRGSQTAWISIYDPPELTAPRNGTEAPDNASLPLIFNWQPSKHTGGTAAVQYKLQVWEMRMQGVPAQTVAASMTPVFETTTAATTYTAIPAAMNLEPGMQYCWRVTVFDPSGKAVINKNGQSEVREFTYLHTCPAVDEVSASVHNARVDFSWTPAPYHTHFQVELVGDNGVSELNDCYDSQFKLYDFPRGSTWKVRVRGECSGGLEADWSPWSDFEIDPPGTPPTPEECPNCGCDDAPKPRAITNYELKELHEGDTIENRTGRTRFIVLTAVPNGDGSYNGQFYLWLELWKTKVRCDYTDLKVNTDGVIFDGQWRSVRNDGLMVNPAAVAAAVESIKNNVAAATYDNYIRDTVKFNYPIQTIYKDQNDNYIAVLADGTELDVTQRLSNAGHTLIEDSEGNQMAVTGDHRLMSAEQYHNTGKNNTLIKNDNERKDKQIAAGDVVFMPSGNQQYGFDAYDASTNNHPEIYPVLEGGSYRPAYKSVAQWQQDNVKAEPMDGVTFRSQMGTPYAITNGEVILRGEPQPGETPVYAHVAETDSTTKVVGKLNLLTFEPKEINVCLVPVNGASLPNTQTLEKELNKIFKPAVASVKVSSHSGITIEYANGSGFVHGGSGPLTVYSDDEKAAINALTGTDDDTYYLFLVKNVTKLDADGNRTIVSGYMPVGYQHGFIFEQFDVARTYAHELSHGAFALHHTFSANSESFHASEGTTTNLMDYTESGITLNHRQWTWMHEKHGSGLFGFLADEEEGEMIAASDKNSINVSITKFNKDFAPGVGNLEIEYSLNEQTQGIITKYPNEDFHIFFAIANNKGNIVHIEKQNAKSESILTWDGFTDKEKKHPISFEDGPYKVNITLLGGKKIEGVLDVESWQEFKDILYQKISGDSVMYISSSVDTSFNMLNDPIKLDYVAYKDEFKRSVNSEEWYVNFVESCKANGYFTDSLAKPMEWLIKKGVKNTSVTFCGQTISEILPELAEMIKLADDYLEENYPNLHEQVTLENKYKPGPYTGVSMRTAGNKKNAAPSLHSFGASVDFCPTFNPYITKGNAVIVKYIKHLTGFDALATKTADNNAYNASKLFLEKLHGKNWIYDGDLHKKVIADYEELGEYNGYSIHELADIIKADVVILGYNDRKDVILEHLDKYRRRIVFDDDAIEGLDILLAHLDGISGDTIASINDTRVEKFFNEYNDFTSMFGDLKELANSLNEKFETVPNNRILRDGFCNIDPEVYEAFQYAHKIISRKIMNKELNVDAGIKYNSSLDAMHFGLCKELVQYLTNNL